MSSFTLRIEFDRPSRQFQPGESVSGRVFVTAQKNTSINGVVITGMWQTHGKGNIQKGEYHVDRHPGGSWVNGQTSDYRFQFTVPPFPATYRGTFLNVDHYVNVRIDISWAIDPKFQEDFIVAPLAETLAQQTDPRLAMLRSKAKGAGTAIGSVISLIMIVLGVIFSCVTFGLTLIIAVVGGWLLFAIWRNYLAERRLGPVSIIGCDQPVVAGQLVPVRIEFVPRSRFKIDAITAKVSGREECVSGTGTNQTTHRHKLYEEVLQIEGALECSAGQPVSLNKHFELPATNAYSLFINQNQILWDIEFRINIPGWPDWVLAHPLLVVPPSAGMVSHPVPNMSDSTPLPFKPDLAGHQSDSVPPTVQYESAEEEDDDAANPVLVDSGAAVPGLRGDLESVVGQLQDLERYSEEGAQIVEQMANDFFSIQVEIDRVTANYGNDNDPEYARGKTVYGKLPTTGCTVIIQLPQQYNASLETLQRGDLWEGKGVIIKWDALYQRLEMMGI
jgi:hypothetical protein